ncbi:MAG: glucose-6-phosphate dehydrogenase [Bacteroidales bacterium]|jgi:glucose-6-phosphate 1-dehydrogenase|nr:glucose-6-phosphate dehydrogenase [Bacteroidales bacterium]
MQKPQDLIIVIFGASGDLSQRKLLPSLFSMYEQGMMPDRFRIIGTGRTEMGSGDFRKKMSEAVVVHSEEKEADSERLAEFIKNLSYVSFDSQDPASYRILIDHVEKDAGEPDISGNMIFYMATPPGMYENIAINLASAGMLDESRGFRRVIIEKPFGYDLESGVRLNKKLHGILSESQIFRIDHYLGKETVQNLMVTRFANGIFEPLWNRRYIQRVEITSAESLGVEGRGGFYEGVGALRDMVQNHLLQMVGLTAMEPPSSLDASSIRNEVLKVFQSLQPLKQEDVSRQVIRGQYTASRIRGICIPGYREEKGVDSESRTETYVAMKFFINNWRWGGVPFYVRTGKRLPTRVTEIVMHFHPTPHHLFRRGPGRIQGNQLVIRIQPDEGILLKFDMKEPGSGFNVKNVAMDFHYTDLGDLKVVSAYGRLLYDVMMGDATLFARDVEVETAWKFIDPILKAWEADDSIKVYGYPAGTWGPEHSNDLIEGEDLAWRYPCRNMADEELYCEL